MTHHTYIFTVVRAKNKGSRKFIKMNLNILYTCHHVYKWWAKDETAINLSNSSAHKYWHLQFNIIVQRKFNLPSKWLHQSPLEDQTSQELCPKIACLWFVIWFQLVIFTFTCVRVFRTKHIYIAQYIKMCQNFFSLLNFVVFDFGEMCHRTLQHKGIGYRFAHKTHHIDGELRENLFNLS